MAELTATRTVAKDAVLSQPLDAARWQELGEDLAAGQKTLVDLWGDTDRVHMAVTGPDHPGIRVVPLLCPDKRFPSIGRAHAPAIRLERAARDLYGLEPEGLPDQRPWLDHGRWPVRQPLGERTGSAAQGEPYSFLPVEGEGLHQIPVGPVHAGIIEPGHFRFTASGETVVRLEERLGYAHKGIERLMAGQDLEPASRIAARLSGDSTVACSWAFVQAVEGALDFRPPPRAVWLRGVMAELERIANHLGDIGAICNDAAFAMLHAECGILREAALRTCARAFGHRLMMDRIVPGGVAADLTHDGEEAIRALCGRLSSEFPELIELYDNTASLQDRTAGTGVVKPSLAAQFAAPGFVGRASGRAFDARVSLPYAPYDTAPVEMVVRQEGDVDARVWVRILEIERSISWLRTALTALPSGPVRPPSPAAPG